MLLQLLVAPRLRRRPHDLIKSIVLLCISGMAILTVHTLPHLQRMLDGTCCTSDMFLAGLSRSIAKQQQKPESTSEQHSSSLCWNHTPVQANNSRVSVNDTLLVQPTAACGRLRRRHFWEAIAEPTSDHLSPLAQEIYKLQNNCSLPTATFELDNDFGLGSHLHLWSQALCNAWQHGWRLQTHNPHWLWLDQAYCDPELAEQSPLLCYFSRSENQCPPNSATSATTPNKYNITIPDPRITRLRCRRLQDNPNAVSEFRAAAIEYLFHRALSHTVIREAERQLGLQWQQSYATAAANNNNGHDHHFLIAVHMRWGDKFWEMDLAPASEYVEAVQKLLPSPNNNSNNNNHSSVAVYLACEDPRAVREFLQAAPADWKVYVDRTVTELNAFRPTKGNRASWTTRNTKGRAGLVALGSLLVALEADSFVLTTKSNWSRLINELRQNVLDVRCGNCTRMIDLRPGEW